MKSCKYLFKNKICTGSIAYLEDDRVEMRFCNYLDAFDECPIYNQADYYYHHHKPTRYVSKSARYDVLKRQKWHCNICGEKLNYSKESDFDGSCAHIDHIHPFSKWETYDGDINEVSNLQALCSECNLKKRDNRIN